MTTLAAPLCTTVQSSEDMKPSRESKCAQQLADAEERLRELLTPALRRVSSSGEQLFTNSRNLPEEYSPRWLPPEAERLFAYATECIELRERLGLPSEHSPAALFLAACAESQSNNPHRQGPRQLAAGLLLKVSG